jgi:hypothetical protein
MAAMVDFFAVSRNDAGDLIAVIDNVVCQTVPAITIKGDGKVKPTDYDIWFPDLVARLEATENPREEAPYGSFDVVAFEKAVKAALK